MKFNCCFLKKRFLLLLIALGIGSVLYANDELKLLTDSLRRVIDEKHVFVKEKEDRINRIKCMLKSPGLTLEGEYRINLRLYNEYKNFILIPLFIMLIAILRFPVSWIDLISPTSRLYILVFYIRCVAGSVKRRLFEKYKDFRTSQRFINKLLSNLFQFLGALFYFCCQQSVWKATICLSGFTVCSHRSHFLGLPDVTSFLLYLAWYLKIEGNF